MGTYLLSCAPKSMHVRSVQNCIIYLPFCSSANTLSQLLCRPICDSDKRLRGCLPCTCLKTTRGEHIQGDSLSGTDTTLREGSYNGLQWFEQNSELETNFTINRYPLRRGSVPSSSRHCIHLLSTSYQTKEIILGLQVISTVLVYLLYLSYNSYDINGR